MNHSSQLKKKTKAILERKFSNMKFFCIIWSYNGEGVVWYTGLFYAMNFMKTVID
jgi:hypothetical protein